MLSGLGLVFLLALWRPAWFFPIDTTDNSPQNLNTPTAQTFTGYAQAVKKASEAVVNIYANKVVTERGIALINDPALRRILGVRGISVPRKRLQRSLGSGVIVNQSGLILTNHHVIQGADDIQVLLPDGRESKAQLIGTDPESDLAVLQIGFDHLPSVHFSDSESLEVGDIVLAIGNPFGIGQTVTQGILSARQRGYRAQTPFTQYLQTDAAINEGNSGGALINVHGEVVGINAAVLSGSEQAQGISFAIPSNLALEVLEEITKFGRVRRGWLGIEIDDNYPLLRAQASHFPEGVRIAQLTAESPADQAGLLPGDIITAIDEMEVDTNSDILAYLARHKPGELVNFQWIRNGLPHQTDIILGERQN